MVFSSITFLLFFIPVVLTVFYILPAAGRNIFLLAASLFFYAWGEPVYVLLMLASILMNYSFGLLIERARKARMEKGRLRMHLGIITALNLALLFYFKYCNMLIGWINTLFRTKIPALSLSLPIGISFYTFQALSYVIDVYRGKVKAQRSITDFGLYISMFPQLIAGPIVRYKNIEEQFKDHPVDLVQVRLGLFLFVKGLAKKVLLANVLGGLFTEITSLPSSSLTALTAWTGALAYSLQLYFDFSGYSDMAIGLGRLLGFSFSENFDHPYTAVSVTDFWRRWHISLSSWFREYVYIPLGGNRVSTGRHIRNLLIVWMLTGLWHGTSLNFILWGLYYGIWLILEKYVLGDFLRKHRIAGRIYTLMIVVLGWMLFAITDFKALGMYLRAMFGMGAGAADHRSFAYLMSYGIVLLAGAVCSAGWPGKQLGTLCRKHERVLAGILAAAFVLCLASLAYDSFNPFLYFRF